MAYYKLLTLSPRGQLVLPKKAREMMGLRPSSRIKLTANERGQVILEPVGSATAELRGSAKSLLKGVDPVKFVRQLREERS